MSNLDDPNPVLQSVVASAREAYKAIGTTGGTRMVSCSRSLLDRSDPSQIPVAAFDRLAAWAKGAGLGVSSVDGQVRVNVTRKPGGKAA